MKAKIINDILNERYENNSQNIEELLHDDKLEFERQVEYSEFVDDETFIKANAVLSYIEYLAVKLNIEL